MEAQSQVGFQANKKKDEGIWLEHLGDIQ